MPKINRTVVYTLVGAVAAYAVVLYTQPDTPAPHHAKSLTGRSAAGTSDPNDADMNAHFPRYAGGRRDPFVPGIVPVDQDKLAGLPQLGDELGGPRSAWALTGINTINGRITAVVENSASGDTVYLKPGDAWNGLHVVEVGSDAVVFVNALGQQTRLAFSITDTGARTAAAALTDASGTVPSVLTVTPLPPMPVADTRAGRRGRRYAPAQADSAPSYGGNANPVLPQPFGDPGPDSPGPPPDMNGSPNNP